MVKKRKITPPEEFYADIISGEQQTNETIDEYETGDDNYER